jgi:hypothetical protein
MAIYMLLCIIIMSDWKIEFASTIEEMWNEHHMGKMYAQVVCHKCGGATAPTCPCAKAAFIDTLTKEEVDQYISEKDTWRDTYASTLDEMWENQWVKRMSQFKAKPCDTCGGNRNLCACMKQSWLGGKTRLHVEEYLNSAK